ncbi:MAG: hypothetical protein A2731_01925 [Candidatus Buchananbacteria bacterium RIFCSPHIGHO2_01_FULL_39_8]|uniref:Uncharacterized protein n=1 Tax=Candidatus Buchananbacteria bacterium RIFCSPHIGHO2_01_FULL_39_8 TaxID=1797533 RepID=A0A1G1Y0K0_9BACT|nr:hypothetical protein [uncultured bacterium]OGY45859.1 MAG: hypothetical protein A2731_01925 [Candidatus Buchananbacteria bacterium RIFCSPHIGHO2_01_FULL_39_8]
MKTQNHKNMKTKGKKTNIFVFLCFCVFVIFSPFPVLAEYYFNPHFVLTDEEMEDYDSLSLIQIQRFLEEKGSGLAKMYLADWQENVIKASTIIWQAAQESSINPKVLLATLQKEQSLVGEPNPTQRQIDRAMGYRCPDDGVCNPSTLHFGKQVDGAAWQFRQYMDNPLAWNFRADESYNIDGWIIRPVNTATAGLYNYTPHYSGNQRFWQIWQDYWGKNYPEGSLVKVADDPGVWLIQYGSRRLITAWAVLLSRFDPRKILTISRTDLEKYEIGPSIKFPNYSLLGLPDGKIYLVVDDEIRYITSPEVFRIIGFNPEEIELVTEVDLVGYEVGKDITAQSIYPTGALLQDKTSGGVYFVEDGIKQPIYSKEIMEANFPKRILTQVSPEELDQYQTGAPVKFKDGELIKSREGSEVYVISNGNRRWIKSEEAFAKYSYKWDNIIVTSQQAVNIHPLDEEVE